MRIIVLGAGQVGSTVARTLAEEGNDVTVIDTDVAALDALESTVDLRTVPGHAAHPATLRIAGVEDCDMLIAATSSDETNIVASQIAYTLYRTPMRIARIRAREYTREKKLFSNDHIPIDGIISPEELVTEHIARIIEHPGAIQVVDFASGRVRMVGVEVQPEAAMAGRPLSHLPSELGEIEARVAAIYRDGEGIIPTGSTVVRSEDIVFFLAPREHTSHVMARFHPDAQPCKRVMIAGGGNIGELLAKKLERHYRVKLIEADTKRSERLAANLRSAMVLEGDAANQELLTHENIHEMDVFCALTNDDEANILSAMLARRMGARKVMSLINRAEYAELVERDIIDVAISPQQITIGELLTRIRRGDVVGVHSLRRGSAEALEGVAHGGLENSEIVGRSIGELSLPPTATVGMVVRGERALTAHHDLVIEDRDHLIVLVTDRAEINEVEKLFQVGVTFV